jgi:hypothetical protein
MAGRSPFVRQGLHAGAEVYLSYAFAHAEGAGGISGGLTDFSPPDSGYFLLNHDQRHTLHTGFNFNLPWRAFAGGNMYYGSDSRTGPATFRRTCRNIRPSIFQSAKPWPRT